METYYSNCLFEAIKAKLKSWKNVRILYIPKHFNIDGTSGHFIWTDSIFDPDDQYFFEFCAPKNRHNHIWFKGIVSRTKRSEIERMFNIALARNKKLRKLEKAFGIKFNSMKFNEMQKLIGKCDWKYVDPDFYPLPKITDFPGAPIFDPVYYEYDVTQLKPKILGKVYNTNLYKNYYFDEQGNIITNGDNIEWWRWDFYKEPSALFD